MYFEEDHVSNGEVNDKPKIHWNEEDKYAIIAFLLMSVDKRADENGKVRLDDLFGLNETAPEPEGEEGGAANEKREARDTVVRECEKFLAGLSDDERYDIIQDEIDRFIEGEDGYNAKCAIGGSYGTFGSTIGGQRKNKLEGGISRIWNLVKLVVFDADYEGDKKRLLKHLARKWNIDGTVLPALEDMAKTFAAITKERRELSESDKPFREVKALLLELEAREKETWETLKRRLTNPILAAAGLLDRGFDGSEDPLEKMKRRMSIDAALAAVDGGFLRFLSFDDSEETWEKLKRRLVNATLAAAGLLNPDFEAEPADEGEDEKEYEEPGLGYKIADTIADGICFGIEKVTDIICAPIEWMTDKITSL